MSRNKRFAQPNILNTTLTYTSVSFDGFPASLDFSFSFLPSDAPPQKPRDDYSFPSHVFVSLRNMFKKTLKKSAPHSFSKLTNVSTLIAQLICSLADVEKSSCYHLNLTLAYTISNDRSSRADQSRAEKSRVNIYKNIYVNVLCKSTFVYIFFSP